jgi:hypothetical protein
MSASVCCYEDCLVWGFIDFLPYSSCPVCVSWNISQKDYSIQAVGSTRELTAKVQYDNRGLELDKARGRY